MRKHIFVVVFWVEDLGHEDVWELMAESAGQAVMDAHELFPDAEISKVYRKGDW